MNRSENNIGVGVVGAGFAAAGLIHQVLSAPDMELVGIFSRTAGKARRILEPYALGNKAPYVTDNPDTLTSDPAVSVIVDATGSVEFGCRIALESIKHGKHLVLVNAELDASLGPILKTHADSAGVVYTQADGDQPAVLMHLYREIKSLGLKPVLLGNIKTVFDRYRTPKTQLPWATVHGQSPRLATEAVDGTKLAIEMATVSNATGIGVEIPGMHGIPCALVGDALAAFRPHLETAGPMVDFILGAQPSFGVFAIGHTTDLVLKRYLAEYKMGEGPYYLFYRPYHLCTLESHQTIRRAVRGETVLAPAGGPVTEVAAYAKTDLKRGTVLDGIGGYHAYGIIDNASAFRAKKMLPIGLSEGCVLSRNIPRDTPITFEDIDVPAAGLAHDLYRKQMEMFPLP